MVPAVDRNADRDLDSLHGLREHCRREAAAAMDRDVRLRVGPRLRVFVPAAAAPAVRRRSFDHVAASVQRRRGDRAAVRAAGDDPRPGVVVPLRRRGADRHHPAVGARRAHRVALGGGSRHGADDVSTAGVHTAGYGVGLVWLVSLWVGTPSTSLATASGPEAEPSGPSAIDPSTR